MWQRDPSLGPLPIAVSITGHRDLCPGDLGRIEALVREIFEDLRRRYPHSPLILLSALADGADRLGARVALECSARLIAPLPMPRALYEKDFSEDSRKDFAELLDLADEWFELPLLPGYTEDDVREYGPPRDSQYAYVGAYLARHSQMIIALWDGVPINLVGGTAFVVEFQLKGIPPPYVPMSGRFSPAETGPVYHIITPRLSNPNPMGEPCTLRKIYPEGHDSTAEAEKAFERILQNIDEFNRDAMNLGPRLADQRKLSKGYLVTVEESRVMNTEFIATLEQYAIADSLALYYRRLTVRTLKILFVVALLATGIFDLYLYFMIRTPIVLTIFFAMLVFAYFLYHIAGRLKFQHKYLDYRALAEGLRVQLFWRLAGVDDSVADNYLSEQRSELDWIRHALRIWSVPRRKKGGTLASSPAPKGSGHWQTILKDWVSAQYSYFFRSSKREQNRLQTIHRWGNIFFLSGLGMAAFHAVYQFTVSDQPLMRLLYVGSIAPIIAGLLFGYAQKMALSDHAKQYERMGTLFARAKKSMETLLANGDVVEARDLVRDLGREALTENGQWVLIHRERPLEVPKA